MTTSPIIQFKDVSFQYSAENALLKDVNFQIEAAEFVVLLGNNGSGKSTIAKLADAILMPNSGCVEISGFDTSNTTDIYEAKRRIGYVFQDPDDQIVATLVRDDVAFGPANLGLARDEVWQRVDTALTKVGMTDFANADVNTLSGGQKQRVAIAGALAMKPNILLLDEPTSMLDAKARDELLDTIQDLKSQGMSILMITHDMNAAKMADRILLLENGSLSEITDISSFEEPLLRARIEVKRKLQASTPNAPQSSKDTKNLDTLITLDHVSFTYDEGKKTSEGTTYALKDVSLEIHRGELLAITGPNGSGKSTLIRLLNGLVSPTDGKAIVFGEDTSTKKGRNAARFHVGICFQYPEKQFFAPSVFADVAAGPTNQKLSQDEVNKRVHEALRNVGFDPDVIGNKNPFALSGGEQRRVAIAGFLAMQPDILVLDEPCANLDIPTHASILELIADLRNAGTTVVLVSHDLEDVQAIATRVVTLENGRITRIDTNL